MEQEKLTNGTAADEGSAGEVASSEEISGLLEQEEQPWMKLSMDGRDIEVGRVENFSITHQNVTTNGCIYYPEGEGPFKVMCFIHGGAFVGGFNFMDEPVCRQICHEVGCAVISPNYQLAPAAKFPAALEELYDLLLYFKEHQAEYSLDMSHLAVGGSSAGGNYAAAVCVKAAQEGNLAISYQALIYPSIDLYENPDDKVTPLTDAVSMPPEGVRQMLALYLSEEDLQKADNPLISPALADAKIFPATGIFSGRVDIFWREDVKFALKLAEAGKHVLYRSFGDTGHGFMELAGREDVSREVRTLICEELRRFL